MMMMMIFGLLSTKIGSCRPLRDLIINYIEYKTDKNNKLYIGVLYTTDGIDIVEY